jgi:RNA recognition motif-containing protein
MNLYVKNLDPTIGNTELFSLFRKFGHIVSARVMSNPATGLSKGYGFVSYSKPEEAALALNEMNGIMVRSKAMVVAYHEPKKPRQEKSSSTTTSSFHSPPSTAPPVEYGTVPYFETRHPHEGKHPFTHLTCHSADLIAILGPSIEPVDPLNLKELSLNPTVPMQRKVKKKKKNQLAILQTSF